MKILITGGHVTPALAVIEELEKRQGIRIIFVGRKYALDFDKEPSFEFDEISKKNIHFINLTAARFTRSLSFNTFINLLKLPIGLLQSFFIVVNEKPNVVMSFGGYLALPIGIAAFILSIPVITHEQTIRPGATNRIIGLFARHIFVAFPQAASFFKPSKTSVSGNPLRGSLFEKKLETAVTKKNGKKLLYVTGGSLGSHVLNVQMEKCLPKLLKDFTVVHQCGTSSQYNDFDRLSKIDSENYYVKRHFGVGEVSWLYKNADVVVSRSGANTLFELIAFALPCVLVPLPLSAYNEQMHQAQVLKESGAGEIFRQEESNSILYDLICKVVANSTEYKHNFKKIQSLYKSNAAVTITNFLIKTAGH